jgi:hypothetical protein
MKRLVLTSLAALATTAAIGCAAPSADYSVSKAPPSAPAQPGYGPAGVTTDAAGGDGAAEAEAPAARQAPMRPGMAPPSPPADHDPFSLSKPKHEPGLATTFGERRHSRVSTAPFARANKMSPFAVGKLFYNDPSGIAAMSDSHPGSRKHTRRFPVGVGHVEFGLRDGNGHFLTGFRSAGNNYIAGIAGRRYTIVVKNHSPGRIEAVVSVDGLDVIDGKPASTQKRGYLIDGFGDLEIEGFRTSTSEVAAFRFGSVKQSYAKRKHGNTRNVGVIGVALFHEKGDNPRHWGSPRTHADVTKRHGADPFPQKFASPP